MNEGFDAAACIKWLEYNGAHVCRRSFSDKNSWYEITTDDGDVYWGYTIYEAFDAALNGRKGAS